MRIAYNLSDQDFHRTQSIGIFNVSVQLLRQLAKEGQHDLQVLGNDSLRPVVEDIADQITFHSINAPVRGKLKRMWWDQSAVYSAATRLKADYLFLPKGFASFLRKPPIPTGAYVHDVIHTYLNAAYPGRKKRLEAPYFDRAIQGTLKHARVVGTNSHFTLDEVARYAEERGIARPPLHYMGIGFDPPEPDQWTPSPDGSVVVFGQPNMPDTNRRLLDYLDRWQQDTKTDRPIHWLAQRAEDPPQHPNWTYHGRLPEEDYRSLIHQGQAVVFASEYEGFGMIPVETVLAGTAAVYSDIPVLREVMGTTGAAFALEDYASFTRALEAALKTSTASLIDGATTLHRAHNWPDVVDRFNRAIEQELV